MNNKDNLQNKPLVSILCITYNHKNYIRQCLDGFVMQKTNFDFIAYVSDDCSTDGTTEIVKEYEYKYPNIIKGIYHSKNTNIIGNYFDVVNACKSKYVAVCEGDDYWIDEYKLQKQVDFLESNPDYAICFHPVKVVYEGFDFEKTDEIYPTQKMIKSGTTFELLLKANFIQTNSVMYRWEFNDKKIEEYFPKDIMPLDWYLHLLHAKEGKIKMLTDVMSVYRRNPSGCWSDSITNMDKIYLQYDLQIINFYDYVCNSIANLSQEYIQNILLLEVKKIIDAYYHNKKFKELQNIYEKYPKYIDMIFSDKRYTKNKFEVKYKKYKKLFKLTLSLSVVLFVALLISILR